MEHFKTVVIPETTRRELEKTTCDICKLEIVQDGFFDAEEIEVRHRLGTSYPEGLFCVDTIFDLCGKCFDEKLVPWLKSQGAEGRED